MLSTLGILHLLNQLRINRNKDLAIYFYTPKWALSLVHQENYTVTKVTSFPPCPCPLLILIKKNPISGAAVAHTELSPSPAQGTSCPMGSVPEHWARRPEQVKNSQPFQWLWLGHPAPGRKNTWFFSSHSSRISWEFCGKWIYLPPAAQWTSTSLYQILEKSSSCFYVSPSFCIWLSRRNSGWVGLGWFFFLLFSFLLE